MPFSLCTQVASLVEQSFRIWAFACSVKNGEALAPRLLSTDFPNLELVEIALENSTSSSSG